MSPSPSPGQNDTLIIVLVRLVGFSHFLAHFHQVALGPLFSLLQGESSVIYTALVLVITLFYGVSGMSPMLCGELPKLSNVVAIKHRVPREIYQSLKKTGQ
jgi:hypothetical protein